MSQYTLKLDWDYEQIEELRMTLRRRHHQVHGREQALITGMLRDIETYLEAAKRAREVAAVSKALGISEAEG